MRNSFYEEIIKNDFYQTKIASENNTEEVKSMLEAFSTEEMEALAAELNIAFEKQAEEKKPSLEELTEAEVPTEEEEEAKEEVPAEEVPTEEVPAKEEQEEVPAEEEQEEVPAEEEVVAEEYTEDEILKVAYTLAEEKLASAGFTLADYVFSKVAHEEAAHFITENAEKLAFVTGKSNLQVADDIILELADLVSEAE